MIKLNFNATILALVTLLTLCIFYGCKSVPDSKVIRQEVLNIHDKLMIDGEKVIKNRMKLDTLLLSDQLKKGSNSSVMKVRTLIEKLNKADESMMDWMHLFKDDFKGKNEQEDLNYYKAEMIKIRQVEDHYIIAIRESDAILKSYNITAAEKVNTMNHKH